ncbi:uncharacterized protein LOC143017612 [Oratosquilla oratoria]|uniref:uncharacterized protein LOC143017612 n=1 Tax=Oratosquilla oratoria TaxID=337810 RepID=UPI003F75FA85
MCSFEKSSISNMKLPLIVILCLVGVALARPSDVIDIEEDHLKHEQEGEPGRAVEGEYRWIAPDGVEYVINYEADHLGFRVEDSEVKPEPYALDFDDDFRDDDVDTVERTFDPEDDFEDDLDTVEVSDEGQMDLDDDFEDDFDIVEFPEERDYNLKHDFERDFDVVEVPEGRFIVLKDDLDDDDEVEVEDGVLKFPDGRIIDFEEEDIEFDDDEDEIEIPIGRSVDFMVDNDDEDDDDDDDDVEHKVVFTVEVPQSLALDLDEDTEDDLEDEVATVPWWSVFDFEEIHDEDD